MGYPKRAIRYEIDEHGPLKVTRLVPIFANGAHEVRGEPIANWYWVTDGKQGAYQKAMKARAEFEKRKAA